MGPRPVNSTNPNEGSNPSPSARTHCEDLPSRFLARNQTGTSDTHGSSETHEINAGTTFTGRGPMLFTLAINHVLLQKSPKKENFSIRRSCDLLCHNGCQ